MKVLHCSDIHLGVARFSQPGQPHSRLDDADIMLWTLAHEVAREHRPDLAIVAGDLFNGRNPKPMELAIAVRFLRTLSDTCPVIVVPGNHDGPLVIGDPLSHTMAWLDAVAMPNVKVALTPGLVPVDGAVVVTVPYPHRRAFDNVMPGADPLERHAAIATALEGAIEVLHDQARRVAGADPVIFASHLTAVGSVVGSERVMRLEDDVSVGSHVLDLFDYAALGHIHKPQRIGKKAVYPGSPVFVDFGEMGQEKGYVLATVEAGKEPLVARIPSLERPMVEVRYPGLEDVAVEGAIVRLVADLDDRAATKAVEALARDLYAAGASYVGVDIRLPDARPVAARALASDVLPGDAVAAYLASRGLEPEPYLTAAKRLMEGS